jgi:hypothetical protein
MAIGTIHNVDEEPAGYWLILLVVGETAFVEFSRRHFERAEEDHAHGELRVRQQGQTTTICFEPDL